MSKVYRYRVKFKRLETDLYEYRYFESRAEAIEFMYELLYNHKFYKICYNEFHNVE